MEDRENYKNNEITTNTSQLYLSLPSPVIAGGRNRRRNGRRERGRGGTTYGLATVEGKGVRRGEKGVKRSRRRRE